MATRDLPVLGADTIVILNGEVLEKPRDAEHAAAMLRLLSGHTHQVMTAWRWRISSKRWTVWWSRK